MLLASPSQQHIGPVPANAEESLYRSAVYLLVQYMVVQAVSLMNIHICHDETWGW